MSNKPNFTPVRVLAGVVAAVVPSLLASRPPGGFVLAYALLVAFLVALVVWRPRR